MMDQTLTTPSAPFMWKLRDILLMAQPLLLWQGGESLGQAQPSINSAEASFEKAQTGW